MRDVPASVLTSTERIEVTASVFLRGAGEVFAVFNARSQDSGNVSYGVRLGGGARYFVKSAGAPDDARPFLAYEKRVAWLWNAVEVARSCGHRALARLLNVIESPEGPLLVYEWLEGELLRGPRELGEGREAALRRFRRLPLDEAVAALSEVYALHAELEQAGWVAQDFRDGCLIYDFEQHSMRAFDLDMYVRGAFVNEMGRMFGSTRFMAPEEFELGARIDARTTVFTLGRAASVLVADSTLSRAAFRGGDALYEVMVRACRPAREERYASVGELEAAWRSAASAEG